MIKPNNYRSGGSPYYFHAGSRTSQYDRPKGDLPAGCQRCTSSGGQVYYFHAASRRSQFERQARWPATTCKSIPSCSGSRPCEGHPQRIVRSLNGSLESYALSLPNRRLKFGAPRTRSGIALAFRPRKQFQPWRAASLAIGRKSSLENQGVALKDLLSFRLPCRRCTTSFLGSVRYRQLPILSTSRAFLALHHKGKRHG